MLFRAQGSRVEAVHCVVKIWEGAGAADTPRRQRTISGEKRPTVPAAAGAADPVELVSFFRLFVECHLLVGIRTGPHLHDPGWHDGLSAFLPFVVDRLDVPRRARSGPLLQLRLTRS